MRLRQAIPPQRVRTYQAQGRLPSEAFPTLLDSLRKTGLVRKFGHLVSRRPVREIGIIAVAYFTYFGVRGLTAGDLDRALSNASMIVRFELEYGLFVEPSVQAVVSGYDWVFKVASWIYLFGHGPIIALVGIWLYRKRRTRYGVYRNALIYSGAIGLVIFVVFPVAPPKLIGSSFIDTVTEYTALYHVLQPTWLTNQLAALPSLHLGWNLVIGIALVRESRHPALRGFGAVMPLVMFMAIIVTANHYFIDAAVGAVVALIGLAVATKLDRQTYWPRLVAGVGRLRGRRESLSQQDQTPHHWNGNQG